MYALKQVVGALATPLVIAAFIGGVALLCGAARKRLRFGLLLGAVAIAYLGSIAPVGDALLAPLEEKYPPRARLPTPSVGYIVVLGSGYTPRDGVPVTAALDGDGLARITEGIRLARQLGTVQLVVSGGAPPGRVPPAAGYAELARDMGIAPTSLIVLDRALDTASEARYVAALLGSTPFLLVTSAYHMPRAMRFMEEAGAQPIAAPTGQRVDRSSGWSWRRLLPTSVGLGKTERALHEYLGLLAGSRTAARAQEQ